MKCLLRRILPCLLIAALLCTGFPTSAAADAARFYGDLDGNGIVTLKDALLVLKHIAFPEAHLEDSLLDIADVNRDGQVTSEDAYEIFLCALGKTPGFNYNGISTNGTVWIASDSIAAGAGSGTAGWGNYIGDYLLPDAVIHNTAVAGTSSLTFTQEENYQTILSQLKAGDVVFICFGHNDTKGGITNEDSATPGSFKYNLKHYFIDPVYRKGAQPILMSSPARCGGIINDETAQYHYTYIKAAQELAEEYHAAGVPLPFIDMFPMTLAEIRYLGKDTSYRRYHKDQIHYNPTGARFAAQLILTSIKNAGWDFAKYIDESKLTDPRSYPHD